MWPVEAGGDSDCKTSFVDRVKNPTMYNFPPHLHIFLPSLVYSEPTTYLREIGSGELPVTLVLLNWRRVHNFPAIFRHIAKHTFITEYIISFKVHTHRSPLPITMFIAFFYATKIWNNNNNMLLDESMLFAGEKRPPGVSVRIINAPQNLHDYAKYLSCSMAKNDYCYFQVYIYYSLSYSI